MRVRTQVTVLEMCLAFLCAMGAGIAGDLYANHSNHAAQGTRHARATHHRGVRSVSRQSHEDHAIEIEVLHEDASASDAGPDGPNAPGIIAPPGFVAPVFSRVAIVRALFVPAPRVTRIVALPARAPPSAV